MKKYLFIILFLFGCETFDVLQDNPLDPSNPDYQKPLVSFKTYFENGNQISEDNFRFEMVGNELVSDYRYRINSADDPYLNSNGKWSEWSSTNFTDIKYPHSRTYELEAQSRYLTGDTSNIAKTNFSNINVNIGLFLYPRNQAVNNNEVFHLEVVTYNYKDGFPRMEIAAVEFELTYDHTKAEFIESSLTIPIQTKADVSIFQDNPNTNTLKITLGKYSPFEESKFPITDVGLIKLPFRLKDLSVQFEMKNISAKTIEGDSVRTLDGLAVDFNAQTEAGRKAGVNR
jgi:hypothetical protein